MDALNGTGRFYDVVSYEAIAAPVTTLIPDELPFPVLGDIFNMGHA